MENKPFSVQKTYIYKGEKYVFVEMTNEKGTFPFVARAIGDFDRNKPFRVIFGKVTYIVNT